MKLGNSYRTSNRNIAFPFKEDAAALVYEGTGTYGANATLPASCLLDASIIVWTPLDICLYSITRVDLTTATLTFHTSTGVLVETFTITLPAVGDPAAMPIIPLGQPSLASDGYNTKLYGRLLASAAFADYLDGMVVGSTSAFGTRLPLSPAICEPRPAKVLTIEPIASQQALVESFARGAGAIDGAIQLRSGYNMESTIGTADTPDTQTIELAAIPGAGLGRLPCEEVEEPDPAVPQQLHPDAQGNITLSGDACYDVLPDRINGIISLHSVCKACCDCEDYVAVGEQLRERLARLGLLYTNLRTTHLGPIPGAYGTWGYEGAVTWWNANVGDAPFKDKNILGVNGYGLNAYKGARRYLTLAMVIRNMNGPAMLQVRYMIEYAAELTPDSNGGWRTVKGATSKEPWDPDTWQPEFTAPLNVTTRFQWELRSKTSGPPPGVAKIYVQYKEDGNWIDHAVFPVMVQVV